MFKAHSVGDAVSIWQGMTGLNGLGLAEAGHLLGWGLAASLAVGLLRCSRRNTQQMGRFDPAWNWRDWRDVGGPALMTWKPNAGWGCCSRAACCSSRSCSFSVDRPFLYFNLTHAPASSSALSSSSSALAGAWPLACFPNSPTSGGSCWTGPSTRRRADLRTRAFRSAPDRRDVRRPFAHRPGGRSAGASGSAFQSWPAWPASLTSPFRRTGGT